MNQAMIEGGGFTASEVSFRLACMKTLGTLRNWFSVKSWRVFDESDEIGGRFIQAFMTLIVGDGTVRTTRGEGAGPVDAMTKALRHELDKWYPELAQMKLGTFTVAALDIKAHDSAAHVRVAASGPSQSIRSGHAVAPDASRKCPQIDGHRIGPIHIAPYDYARVPAVAHYPRAGKDRTDP